MNSSVGLCHTPWVVTREGISRRKFRIAQPRGGVRDWYFWVLGGVALLAGIWAACRAESGSERVGLLLTATGVILAVVIYRHQKSEAAASEKRITDSVRDEIRDVLPIAQKEDEESDTSGDDLYPEAAQVLNDAGVDLGSNFSYLAADKVPLLVLGDLVSVWEEEGKQGRWDVGDLRWCLRRAGRGNHPWFVAFHDPDKKQDRYWKVSRGGRGKDRPSATELYLSNEARDTAI